MKSGYTIGVVSDRPNPLNEAGQLVFPTGSFVEDYEFTDNGDLDEHNGRFCVTGTYRISLPCPRIDKIETTIPKKPSTSKHNRQKIKAWEKKYGGAINTIKNIAIKPEDQVRYMTIY